ncbi:unnamed protein product, partial [Cyprideis torosa]
MTIDPIYRSAITAALGAGKEIMNIYSSDDFGIEKKDDLSPLTLADKAANDYINQELQSTSLPVVSEENKMIPFETRKAWHEFWMVDPLDGTKEFIKRNGEF